MLQVSYWGEVLYSNPNDDDQEKDWFVASSPDVMLSPSMFTPSSQGTLGLSPEEEWYSCHNVTTP